MKIQVPAWRVLAVKVRALVGKECDPVTWDGDVWEDSIEKENFAPSDSQGFVSPELVTLPSVSAPEKAAFSTFD